MPISPRIARDDRHGPALDHHPPLFLHVANGTSTTGTIHAAGIPGQSSIWADPLHDGPVPEDASDDELLMIRARHLTDAEHGFEAIVSGLRRWREVIDGHDAYDELVLWYEHDLFDQLNLIQLLAHLAVPDYWPKPVSLICIGSYPGRPRFKGLGELTPSELGPLFDTRQPVTDEQYSVAVNAWAAFRAPQPTAIEQLLRTDTSALPYLAAALARHLEDFPSTADGLSRTERRLLELAAQAPISLRAAFPRMHDEETAFYIADGTFLNLALELSSPLAPLLAIKDRAGSDRSGLTGNIELTDLGRDVLAGREDRIAGCGIDRWLGGVHLTGPGPHWRWDRAHERVERASSLQRGRTDAC